MTTYATMLGYFGWVVLAVDNGRAVIVANTGTDGDLADQLAEWLTHQDRIRQLVDRHGHVDSPLDDLPPAPPFNPDLDLIGDLEHGQKAARGKRRHAD